MIFAKISKKSLMSNLFDYAIIVLVILGSGAVIGTMNLGKIYLIEIGLLIVGVLMRRDLLMVSKKQFYLFMIFLGYIMINFIIFSDFSLAYEMKFWMNISIMFVYSLLIKKDSLIEKYINILMFLSTTSLLFFSLSQVGIHIATKQVVFIDTTYYMSWFYVYGFKKVAFIGELIAKRNCGIFWEPGAFQGYICLALIFLIFNKEKYKNYKKMLFILILTLISTLSTTGYINFILIILILFFNEKSNPIPREDIYSHIKKINLRKVFLLIGIVVICVFVVRSSTVTDKLTDYSSGSIAVRSNDIYSSLITIFEKPIFGYGHISAQRDRILYSRGVYANSAGLLIIGLWYGIPFSLYWFFRVGNNIIRLCSIKRRKVLMKCLIYTVLIMLMFTEHFMAKQLFILLLFNTRANFKESNQ